MQYQLRLSGEQHKSLQQHLFPGDGKEAVGVALCGRFENDGLSILLAHKLVLIPHEECYREEDFIRWQTDRIVPLLEEAEKYDMAILKIHSHPGGYDRFSKVDDQSDHELFSSVFGWCDGEGVHASAVMLPGGEIFGRVFKSDLSIQKLDKISVAGDQIFLWDRSHQAILDGFALRTIQTFGDGTYQKLKQLKIGVIGCSGTGSPTIEQLVRLGVGHVVIIDPDKVEIKNLNRILNTTTADAENQRFKVKVLENFINRLGLGTKVTAIAKNLYDSPEAMEELISCDIILGCVDSVDGRHLVSQISNFYLIPYFDLGVRLGADGAGGIEHIVASVNYIQPGCSTLLSRGLYTADRLFADGLLRQDPEEFAKREKLGYVRNANVDRPAVISINMQISSMGINELLNRIHPFKDEPARFYARIMMDYCAGYIENTSEDFFKQDSQAQKWVGRGNCKPFLRMPELG
jgi:hypothetical protein